MRARRFFSSIPATLVLVLAQPALSQTGSGIPPQIIEASTLTTDQIALIGQHAAEGLRLLGSEEASEIRRGRRSLLQPLTGERVSTKFRQEYARSLKDGLERHAGADREIVVVNALVVAGELCTDSSVALLDRYSTDARAAVRFESIAGLGRTLAALDRAGAIEPTSAMAIVRKLKTALDNEADALVLDRVARSLIQATEVGRNGFEALRPAASLNLAHGMGERVRALDANAIGSAGLLEVCLRTAVHFRQALTAGTMSPDEVKAAAALAGDLLAYIDARLAKGDFPVIADRDDDAARTGKAGVRTLSRDIIAAAETIVYFSLSALGSAPTQTALAGEFARATGDADARFREGVRGIIARDGVLTRAPFGFDAARFAR